MVMASSEPPASRNETTAWRRTGLQAPPQVLRGVPTRILPPTPYATLTAVQGTTWQQTNVAHAHFVQRAPAQAYPMQAIHPDYPLGFFRTYQMPTPLAPRLHAASPFSIRPFARFPEQRPLIGMAADLIPLKPNEVPPETHREQILSQVGAPSYMPEPNPVFIPAAGSPRESPNSQATERDRPESPKQPEENSATSEIARQNSSSTSDYSHNYDSNSDDDLDSPNVGFECAWIPLKGEDDSVQEPLYLDPSTQQYLSFSVWFAKYGEKPRESLRAKPTSGSAHESLSDNESGWPSRMSLDDTTPAASLPDSADKIQTFAEMVATQNELLRQTIKAQTPQTCSHRLVSLSEGSANAETSLPSIFQGTDILSPSTPDPEPSGPVPLPTREASSSRQTSVDGNAVNIASSEMAVEEPSALNEDFFPEDEARQAMEDAQRQRGIAAQIDVMVNELKVLDADINGQEDSVEPSVTQVLLSTASVSVVSPASKPIESLNLVDETAPGGPSPREESRLTSLTRSGLLSLDRDVSNEREQLRRAYEKEIARLRAEAEEAKRKALEEQQRREEERTQSLLQLQKLQEEAAMRIQRESEAERELRERQEMQLKEMARRTEQVSQLLERLNASASEMAAREFLPFDKHGFTAVRVHLAKLGGFSPQASETLEGDITFYAIIRLGVNDLHSPMSMTLDQSAIQRATTEALIWNDTFNFPYLNERHLSVTIRAKDTRHDGSQGYEVQADHLIGAARVDLSLFILNPMACGPQVLTLFDAVGTPAATAHINLQFSNEVLQYPFLSIKPQAMDSKAINRSQTLSTAFFSAPEDQIQQTSKEARMDSVDSLEETLQSVDFRSLCMVKHPFQSVSLSILSVKKLRSHHKTVEPRLSLRVGFAATEDEWLITSVQPVQYLGSKRGRLLAIVNFNEECRFPFNDERLLQCKLMEIQNSAEMVEIGSASIDIQQKLMSGTSWCREKIILYRTKDGKKQGSLDVILHFSDEITPHPLIGPCSMTHTTSSKYPLDMALKYREEQYRLGGQMMPSPALCQVTIEAATDLKVSEDRIMTPYVRIKLGNFQAETSRGIGQTFRWNRQGAHFGFDLDESWETQILSLECFSGEKFIGLTLMPLTDIKTLPGRTFHGDLQILNKHGRSSGSLSVHVQLTA